MSFSLSALQHPMDSFRCLLTLPLLSLSLFGELINGPMIAHLEMREAQIWVQADSPAVVRIAYATNASFESPNWSPSVIADPGLAYTATVPLREIEPGQTYHYKVELDGALQASAHQFQSPAFYQDRSPPPDFRIAVGSAHYRMEDGYEPPYQIMGGGYEIFETIAASKPALMLWLGDTAHLRSSDWASQSGYLKRYTSARRMPGLAPLLANTPHYATWGASDYGPPDAGAHFSYRQHALASFRAFWPRPVSIPGLEESMVTTFRYADVDFFVLDSQSFRNDMPSSQEPFQILGPKQIEWLRHALIRSTATFKVIVAGVPILNPAKSRSNLSYAESEHTRLLQMLRDEEVPGLFFISGGKYYGELTRLVHASSYNLFDLTVGPLTALPQKNQEELNFFRMPGSSTFERQFALIDFTGPEENRSIVLRIMSMEGKELWTREVKASQLKFQAAAE